jgi:hypothetical protein
MADIPQPTGTPPSKPGSPQRWTAVAPAAAVIVSLLTVVVTVVVFGLTTYFTNRENNRDRAVTRETNRLQDERARQGQITDRYTAAVDQLGHADRNVRLGGIYALARIMDESQDDQPTIVEVLMAYVRDQARTPDRHGRECGDPGYGYDDAKSEEGLDHPWADVQAALTVMGRRNPALDKDKVNPNLSRTCLIGADLTNAQLVGVDLTFTDLTYADLTGAHLDGAKMAATSMGNATLIRTTLTKATITNAEMDNMELDGANFDKATLHCVNLTDTILSPDQKAAASKIVKKNAKECRTSN